MPGDPERDLFVVVCSELPGSRGGSVTDAAERIAGSVIDALGLPVPLVWIEHHPPETTDGATETFDLVVSLLTTREKLGEVAQDRFGGVLLGEVGAVGDRPEP